MFDPTAFDRVEDEIVLDRPGVGLQRGHLRLGVNEVGVCESDFGFHIIRLDKIRGPERSARQGRPAVDLRDRRQRASRGFVDSRRRLADDRPHRRLDHPARLGRGRRGDRSWS